MHSKLLFVQEGCGIWEPPLFTLHLGQVSMDALYIYISFWGFMGAAKFYNKFVLLLAEASDWHFYQKRQADVALKAGCSVLGDMGGAK